MHLGCFGELRHCAAQLTPACSAECVGVQGQGRSNAAAGGTFHHQPDWWPQPGERIQALLLDMAHALRRYEAWHRKSSSIPSRMRPVACTLGSRRPPARLAFQLPLSSGRSPPPGPTCFFGSKVPRAIQRLLNPDLAIWAADPVCEGRSLRSLDFSGSSFTSGWRRRSSMSAATATRRLGSVRASHCWRVSWAASSSSAICVALVGMALPHAGWGRGRGLDRDIDAATAVTPPFHDGRTEGVNTKTKMIKRQMYGRGGFTLLGPHPAQLRPRTVTTEGAAEPLA
jgi:hypothetical protein